MKTLKDIADEIENIAYVEMTEDKGYGKDNLARYKTIGQRSAEAVRDMIVGVLERFEDEVECAVIENSHKYEQDCYYYTLGLIKSAFVDMVEEVETMII